MAITTTPMPTQEQVDAYLRHLRDERHNSPSTVAGYRQELNQMLRRGISFEPASIAGFVSTADDGAPLAATTRNRRRTLVHGFLGFLLARGDLASNPADGIHRARVPRDLRVALGVGDLAKILDVLAREPTSWRRTRDETLLVVLFQTGLRISELRSLDLDQVDLDRGLLLATHRKGGAFVDVPVNGEAAVALRAWLKVRPTSDDAAVFVGGRGPGRLTVRYLQKRLAQLGEKAGLASALHPHALRHAHATALLRAAAHLRRGGALSTGS